LTWILNEFVDDASLVTALSSHVAALANSRIGSVGKATLAVSGGSTPVGLFNKLATQQVDWSRVQVTLVDERWLPPDHEDANALMVHRELLQGPAAAADFVGLSNATESPFAAEIEINARLQAMSWPLAAVILGMGGDGHTASLFPDAETLQLALRGQNSGGEPSLCCAVMPREAPYARMTMTLPALLECEALFLHIRGFDKRQVLERAITEGPESALPIGSVLHQDKVPLQIYYSEN